MAKDQTAVIALRFDTGELKQGIQEVKSVFGGLEKAADGISKTIRESFVSVQDELGNTRQSIQKLADVLKDFGDMMQTQHVEDLEAAAISDSINSTSNDISKYSAIVDSIALVKELLEKETRAWIVNTAAKIADKAIDLAIIALYAVDYIQAFGTVIGHLAASTAAWIANTAAKVADKAMDVVIIALYAVDYIQAFGSVIGHLATSTAAWITNTAAKVASTAAEWAQIAATTAWNAICAIAATVTTAFGAAVAFLTSPIGLVVLAIAALIAIVVLLVQNWDTVKAVALSVWEAIKEAWGSVCSWFSRTVIEPLSEAWNRFAEAFGRIWDRIVSGVKSAINSVIRVINGMISAVTDGINALFRLLSFNIALPGGRSIGLNLPQVSAPQIPYLAKGAVIPPNREFMAVLGDQTHGNNIEAPEDLIRKIVREETAGRGDDQLAALLEELIAVVGNIRVGDDVIGRAAQRYNRSSERARGW